MHRDIAGGEPVIARRDNCGDTVSRGFDIARFVDLDRTIISGGNDATTAGRRDVTGMRYISVTGTGLETVPIVGAAPDFRDNGVSCRCNLAGAGDVHVAQ